MKTLNTLNDITYLTDSLKTLSEGDIVKSALLEKMEDAIERLKEELVQQIEDEDHDDRMDKLINESARFCAENFLSDEMPTNEVTWCRFILPSIEKWAGATPEWIDMIHEKAKKCAKNYKSVREFLEETKKELKNEENNGVVEKTMNDDIKEMLEGCETMREDIERTRQELKPISTDTILKNQV